jgi:hypothetical protein
MAHVSMAYIAQAIPWYLFLSQKTPHPATRGTILLDLTYVALLIFQVIILARSGPNALVRWAVLISALSASIGTFSSLYWSYGTPANFGTQLTRFDAFYFSLGTLSTAGSGNIMAISDVSREIQLLQMALDLGLVLFAVGIAINRLSSSPAQKRVDSSQVPKQTGGRQKPKQTGGRRARKRTRKQAGSKQPANRSAGSHAGRQADGKRESTNVRKARTTDRRASARRALHLSFGLILAQIFIWESFFRQTRRPSGTSLDIVSLLAAVGAISLIFIGVRIRWTFLELFTIVGNAFAVLLLSFATFYWNNGSTANFNLTLTRVDSVYFAMGTLSTAGTGNIAAISESARVAQVWQMVLGLILVLFAAGIAISRLSSDSLEKLEMTRRNNREKDAIAEERAVVGSRSKMSRRNSNSQPSDP